MKLINTIVTKIRNDFSALRRKRSIVKPDGVIAFISYEEMGRRVLESPPIDVSEQPGDPVSGVLVEGASNRLSPKDPFVELFNFMPGSNDPGTATSDPDE